MKKVRRVTKLALRQKKRKTRKSQKQLVIFKEIERIGSPTVGEEVAQSLATRTQVKTKVESSLS